MDLEKKSVKWENKEISVSDFSYKRVWFNVTNDTGGTCPRPYGMMDKDTLVQLVEVLQGAIAHLEGYEVAPSHTELKGE